MKVWIGHRNLEYVEVFPQRPNAKWWDGNHWNEPLGRMPVSRVAPSICRSVISRLLRGSGKKLPKLGTNELVEVEIFVK